MTKVKEIISSGILEEFVSGNPSKEVQAKVAAYIIDYPEIRSYIEKLELSLERMAVENAVEPPANWKATVLRNLNTNEELQVSDPRTKVNKNNWLNYLGSFILGGLLVSTFAIYQLNKLQKQLKNSEAKVNQLEEECKAEQLYFAEQKLMLEFIQNPKTDIVMLDKITANSESEILVYWNKETRKAIAKIHILPKLSEQEDYQLWADVAGEMINVGLLPEASNEFVSLGFVENASSLNVTIEPKGGSEHPTVSRLILSAKV